MKKVLLVGKLQINIPKFDTLTTKDVELFSATNLTEVKSAFKEAVMDYIEICRETGQQVFKSFKRSFEILINPELHSKAYENALLEGKTLNQFVKEAIEQRIQQK